jgi:hypothetical protein
VLVYAVAIGAALLVPLLTRGSYRRLLAVEWHWGGLLLGGLVLQVVLEFVTIPRDRWHDVGFGLLIASYALILGFACRNLVLRGMGIVVIGIACNFVVIAANQGMPVKIPAEWADESWAQPTIKHHPQQDDDKLRILSDIIVLKGPFQTVISFGDIILAVGLCDVAFHASRRVRPRRALTIDLRETAVTDGPPPDPDLGGAVALDTDVADDGIDHGSGNGTFEPDDRDDGGGEPVGLGVLKWYERA